LTKEKRYCIIKLQKQKKGSNKTMKIIKNELKLTEDEYDSLYEASLIIKDILNCLDDDEELAADGVSYYTWDDVQQTSYFLNELVDCVVAIERKGKK
jgi:hypothetical protein